MSSGVGLHNTLPRTLLEGCSALYFVATCIIDMYSFSAAKSIGCCSAQELWQVGQHAPDGQEMQVSTGLTVLQAKQKCR